MNHIAIIVLKWGFLALGVGAWVGAMVTSDTAVLPLVLMGLVLVTVGGGLVAHGRWWSWRERQLRQHGRLVQATLHAVELNESIEVFGSTPYRVVAQWQDDRSATVHVFRSINLWHDPTGLLAGKSVPVYMDPARPTRYVMDLSSLAARPGHA